MSEYNHLLEDQDLFLSYQTQVIRCFLENPLRQFKYYRNPYYLPIFSSLKGFFEDI